MSVVRPSYPFLRSYLFYLVGVLIVTPFMLSSVAILTFESASWQAFELRTLEHALQMSLAMTIPAMTVILPPIIAFILAIQPPGSMMVFGSDVLAYWLLFLFLLPSSWFFMVSMCFLTAKWRLWMLWREWALVIAVAAAIPVLTAMAVRMVST
ncbi:MAG: hypothetical protein AAFT19_11110 [Pseudomonadota bacterium]